MTQAHKFTGHAYVTSEFNAMELHKYLKTGEVPAYLVTVDEFLANTIYVSGNDKIGISEWIRVGTVTVEFTPMSDSSVQEAMVESIRAQITETKANAENEITRLTKKLNELLAITM